jgi:hypothetical protein
MAAIQGGHQEMEVIAESGKKNENRIGIPAG